MNKAKNETEQWLTLNDVADRLEISHEAARRLVKRGTLAARETRRWGNYGRKEIQVPKSAVDVLLRDPAFQRRRRA
jgi:orotate phosphoribosyltransferase-like protein